MPFTLLQIREDVIKGYRMRYFAKSAVATAGSSSQIADLMRQEPDGEWDRIDSWIYFPSGAAGQMYRRVTGWSAATSTLTFAPSLAAIGSGAPYQLFKSIEPNQIDLAINEARRATFPERKIQSVGTLAESFPTATGVAVYRYAVPSAAANTVTQLIRVERSMGTTNSPMAWQPLNRGFEYELISDPTDGTITYIAKYVPVDQQLVRFIGERPVPDLNVDSDSSDEPEQLVILGARLFLARQEGDQGAVAQWLPAFEQAKSDYQKKTTERITMARPRVYVGNTI